MRLGVLGRGVGVMRSRGAEELRSRGEMEKRRKSFFDRQYPRIRIFNHSNKFTNNIVINFK